MSKKKRVNIYVDEDVVKKAKEIGLNVSKTCENCLKEAIRRLETPNPQTNNSKGGIGTVGSDLVDRAGFEPAAFAMPTRRSIC